LLLFTNCRKNMVQRLPFLCISLRTHKLPQSHDCR
jgi:hypothetical protein